MNRLQYVKDNLDVVFTHEYVYEDRGEGRQRYDLPDIVSYISLGLTPAQWCGIAMSDPLPGVYESYIGGCCGNTSYCQDIINGAFRDGGSISGTHLLELGRLLRDHEGFDEFEAMDDEKFMEIVGTVKLLEKHPDLDPWAKIGIVFNAVEDMLTMNLGNKLRPEAYHDKYPEEKKILNRVSNTLNTISWNDLWRREDHPDENVGTDFLARESEEDRHERHMHHNTRNQRHEASRVLNFARLLEPLRKLSEAMESMDDEFVGWAIVDPEDKPIEAGLGPCIFSTKEDCEWYVSLWTRDRENDIRRDIPEQNRTVVPEHRIVPVKVTVKDGLVVG